jgi:hypothetical protein
VNPFGKRRKRQLGGFGAAATTTTKATTKAIIALSVTLPPLQPTTQAASAIDESAYKGYFEVAECTVSQSFICVVKFTELSVNGECLKLDFLQAKGMRTPMQKQQDCMATFNITQSTIHCDFLQVLTNIFR